MWVSNWLYCADNAGGALAVAVVALRLTKTALLKCGLFLLCFEICRILSAGYFAFIGCFAMIFVKKQAVNHAI